MRMIPAFGAFGNGFIIAIWVVSRTVGLPFGPESGTPEPIEFIDALATTFQVLIVAGCLALLLTRRHSLALTGVLGFSALLVLGLVVALLTTLSIIWSGQHHHGNGAEPEQHGLHQEMQEPTPWQDFQTSL